MSAALTWLCASERPIVAPLLRVVACAWLLIMRLIDVGPHAIKVVVDRPPTVLDATHLVAVMDAFGAWPATAEPLRALWLVALVSCGLALLGLATRPALLVCFASSSMLVGLAQGYGFFNHTPALPILVLLALAVVPGTTAVSLDALIAARARRADWRGALWPPVPRFGDVLVLDVVGLVYASAGIAKLRGGIAWLDGTALAYYLSGAARTQHWLFSGDDVVAYSYLTSPDNLARALSRSPLAMVALSWATVLFEVIAPFALIWSRRTCVAFCAAAVAFHLLVTWLMHINFVDWIVVDVTIAAAAVAGPLLHPRAPGH